MKIFLLIAITIIITSASGQEKLLVPYVDSIGIDFRSNGKPLELIDGANIGKLTLRPAAGFAQQYEHNLAQNIFESPAGFTYLPNNKKVDIKRSPLPYLGFQYAFGSGLNQAVNVDYHHFITEQSHYHFRYHRRVSNGLLRRGEFTLNDIHLLVHHKQNNWRIAVDAYFGGYDFQENGGIVNDDELGILPIEFVPVRKSNASTLVRKVDLKVQNYYSMYKDSVISHGWKQQTRFETVRRLYEESPVLGVYENIFIDSTRTRDHFQTPSISNGGGYYFSSKFLEVDATLNHRYWRNQNLGTYRDTTELFLHSQLWMGWEKLYLRNEFYFNTLGALGEFYNYANVRFKPRNNWNITGHFNLDNRLPLPYQRFHSANNVAWELEELQAQQILNLGGELIIGNKNKFSTALNWTTVNNGLYFIENQWRQDTLNFISVGDLTFKGEYHIKNWHFYPSLTLRFNTENFAFQPAISTLNRIAYKKGFFKDESLILSFGLDLGYDLAHSFLVFNPLLNTMDVTPGVQIQTPDLIRINFFTALEIDQFRFFIRAENIDYFINDPKSRIDLNFPIMPFIIRLGITWDFFN